MHVSKKSRPTITAEADDIDFISDYLLCMGIVQKSLQRETSIPPFRLQAPARPDDCPLEPRVPGAIGKNGAASRIAPARRLLVCDESQVTVRLHFDPVGGQGRRVGALLRLLTRQLGGMAAGHEI